MTDTTRHQHTGAYSRGDRSPEALEHEIDVERNHVADTIDALQKKLSVGAIVDDLVRAYGHDGAEMGKRMGRNLSQRVADNPLPVILTGVGIAWLIAGSRRDGRSVTPRRDDYLWEADEGLYGEDELYGEDVGATRRYGQRAGGRGYAASDVSPYGTSGVAGPYAGSGGPVHPAGGSGRDTAEHAAWSAREGAAHYGTEHGGNGHSSWGDTASHAAGSVSHGAGRAAGAVYDAAGSVAGGARSMMGAVSRGLGGAAHAAGSAFSGVSGAARSAGGSIGRGGSAARHYSGTARRRFGDMLEEQPLVVGALALVVGAALGAAMPRTRLEDDYIGEYGDEARRAARDMAASEARKARRVAGAVADEAREIADEMVGEVRDRVSHGLEQGREQGRGIADRVRSEAGEAAERLRDAAREEARRAESEVGDAAERLSRTAKDEAERQNLGNPGKPAT